jgi:hypothetical protein
MRDRSLLILLLVVFAVAACSAAVAPSASTPSAAAPNASASVGPRETQPSRSGAPSESPAAAVPAAWLLVGRPGDADLSLVMAATGEVDSMPVPDGAPAAHWRRVVTATTDGTATIVRDRMVQPGSPEGPELRLAGHWQLPTVGLDPVPVGRSLDGSTIVLVQGAYRPDAGVTRFAVVQHFSLGAVQTGGDDPLRLTRIVELRGAFDYDTLSADGSILYVIEHLDAKAGGAYQVRAIDVATGVMRDGVIVDKGNPDERMAGSAVAQIRRSDGLVLTLYRGPEHPFVHALNSKDAWALCIDLPGAVSHDGASAADWDLAASPDGSAVFAVNASLGLAVDVDPTNLAVRRTATIGTTAAARIVLAKFGHSDLGPVGRRVVVGPSGEMLFAAGADGVVAVRTGDLSVARHDLIGSRVDALGLSPDGTTLFVLLHDGGRIAALDAATGAVLGVVPGGGFDRLLAVAPW